MLTHYSVFCCKEENIVIQLTRRKMHILRRVKFQNTNIKVEIIMSAKKDYYIARERYNKEKLDELTETLPPYCKEYFLSIAQSKEILTRVNYARDLIVFFEYIKRIKFADDKITIAEIPFQIIEELTPLDINAYMDNLSYYKVNDKAYENGEDGKARKIAALSGFIAYLVKTDKLEGNVIDKIERPKLHSKNIIYLEPDEVSNLINVIMSGDGLTPRQLLWHEKTMERDIAITLLFLGTGMRVSELVGLDVNDIIFSDDGLSSARIIRKGGNEDIVYLKALLLLSPILPENTLCNRNP